MGGRRTLLVLTFLLGAAACGHVHHGEHADHTHGVETHTQEDPPVVSVTVWSDEIELFMEHPVPRVGEPAKFAVHLTKLSDFQPLSGGPVRFRFSGEGMPSQVLTVEEPTVPGIFGPTATFDQAGEYFLRMEILSDELEAVVDHGPIRVREAGAGEEDLDQADTAVAISYLKEQQWTLPFAAEPIRRREVKPTIRVAAEVIPRAGGEIHVTAPMAGRYLPPPDGVPILGDFVARDQALGFIELLPLDRSNMVGARIDREMALIRLREEISRAEAAVVSETSRLALAERETERVSSLVEIQALPERRLEQARTEVEIVRASLQAAGRTLESHRETLERVGTVADVGSLVEEPIPVPAPIGGVVVESAAVEGRYVDGRQTLFRIVDSGEVWLKGRIFERDLHPVRSFEGGTAVLPGLESIPLAPGAMVTVGTVLDPAERTAAVVFRLRNPGNRIRLGSMGTLELEIGESRNVLAAPRSAVLLEENRNVVYVQLGGEEFERRIVRTGAEDRRWVEILDGLEEGDRVVTIGAYDVALAARSVDIADHGHVH